MDANELRAIELFVEDMSPCTVGEVATGLELTVPQARRRLAELVTEGRIERSGIKRGTRYSVGSPAGPTPGVGDSYLTVVRDAGRRLREFTVIELHAELKGMNEGTLREHMRDLEERGIFAADRSRRPVRWSHVRVEGATPARPRQVTPEAEAVRVERNGNGSAPSGRRMRVGHDETRELVRSAEAAGATVERAPDGHLRVTLPNGAVRKIGATPGTRGTRNDRARLRRAGLDI